MRLIPYALFVLLCTLPSFAQTDARGKIEGRLTTAENNPAAFVNVVLKGTRLGTTSDENGSFIFSNVEPGQYTLQASSVGVETLRETVTVTGEQTVQVSYQLKTSVKQLQTVEIIGRKETTYTNEQSFIGSKTATALRDLPQSVAYVTKELLQDQAVFRLNDAVKNFSGVNQFSFYNDITIRGHRVSGGDNYASLVNGLRANSSFWKQNLTPHLERVEVLKGPASALFGNTSPGGTINRVTKKPLDESRQSLSFSTGSFNTTRALADFTGPMNEDKTLLYRLNIGYENAMNFRDAQYDKNLIVAPSVSFLPSQNTRLNFDLVYQKSDGRLDRGQAVLGTGDLYSVPITRSINRANDYLKEETYNLTLSLNHRFSDRVSFNSSYMRTGYEEDLLEHRGANTYAKDATGKNIDTQLEMQVFIRKRRWFDDNISNYFNIDLETGPLKHRLVVGYDYAQQKLAPGGTQLVARGYRNAANTASINTFVPANAKNYLLDSKGNPVPNVAHFDLTDPNGNFLTDMSKYFYTRQDFPPTFYYTQGLYVQDQISVGKLKALLGLRQDWFTEYANYRTATEKAVTQSALLPRLGLVYSLNQAINLYGTYTKGYQPQTASQLANPNAGGPFNPLQSSLIEGGAKTEWLSKRLTVNAAIYRLEVNGALYNAGLSGQPDLLVQIGQEVAKGFEFDVLGQLAQNWSVQASYAYNDATITASKNESDIGRQKPNAPRHQGSFWTKYVVDRGALSGVGFGLGTNLVSNRFGSIVATGAQPVVLPGYQLWNAAIYYRVNKFQVQANLNNLTNKTHWVGGYDSMRLFPGAPRNYVVTVAYTF